MFSPIKSKTCCRIAPATGSLSFILDTEIPPWFIWFPSKVKPGGYHKGSIPYFFLLHNLASVRRHLELRSEHFTRTTAHEHAL